MEACINYLIMLVQILERRPGIEAKKFIQEMRKHSTQCEACDTEMRAWANIIREKDFEPESIEHFLEVDRSTLRADHVAFDARLREAYAELNAKRIIN